MAARDLDIIRGALGETKLNYLGMSYGTYLGAVYAHLFPGKVGRMVLDSVEEPTGGFPDLLKAQAEGYEDALQGWAAGCATRPLCQTLAPGKTAAELVALVRGQAQQLAANPLPVAGSTPITQADYLTMAQTGLSMGDTNGGWTLLDGVVFSIAAGEAATIAGFRDYTAGTPNLLSANVAIQCYDRPVAGTTATSVAWSKAWGKFSPTFGPSLGWGAQPCFTWPVRQAQPRVDVTPVTKAPVLLIGGTHDPNTPLWMAKKTAPLFAGGRLLVWDGYGHVSANRSIPCVNNAAAAYLVSGTLPATGTICPAQAPPA
jgi:pimeloyl-ACP methyl ester carboxylesterase